MNSKITALINSSPALPGIYQFMHKSSIIYIGKATNLHKRLKSYLPVKGYKNITLDKEADNLKFIITENDVAALLLESKLVKKHQPRLNVMLKDDSSYFYVKITKHIFPKIFITHNITSNDSEYIGPFTSGSSLKQLLNILRKSFPYCTCKTSHKKPCLSSQLNLCPGYCCDTSTKQTIENKKEYQNNIKIIKEILLYNDKKILKELYRTLEIAIKSQDFEIANLIKNKIISIKNIFKHKNFIQNDKGFDFDEINGVLKKIFKTKKDITYFEMYDVSNISGKFAVASMVVFNNGLPLKDNYRKFKIKYTELSPNDVLMMREVFNRRINQSNWPVPNLLLVDGGISQLNVAISVFKNHPQFKNIYLGGLAKGKKQLLLYIDDKVKYFNLVDFDLNVQHFFRAIQDESHRFAIAYHHKLYLEQLKNEPN